MNKALQEAAANRLHLGVATILDSLPAILYSYAMSDYAIRVTGTETDLNAYRQQLLDDLKAEGVPVEAIEISAAKPVRRKLTDPAPLGHVEWLEIVVKIVMPLVTPVVTELVKAVIARRAQAAGVQAQEQPAAQKA